MRYHEISWNRFFWLSRHWQWQVFPTSLMPKHLMLLVFVASHQEVRQAPAAEKAVWSGNIQYFQPSSYIFPNWKWLVFPCISCLFDALTFDVTILCYIMLHTYMYIILWPARKHHRLQLPTRPCDPDLHQSWYISLVSACDGLQWGNSWEFVLL